LVKNILKVAGWETSLRKNPFEIANILLL